MKKLFLIALAVTISSGVFAQTDPQTKPKNKKDARRERVNALLKMEEEGELIFRKQSIFGFKATTDGWALNYEIGKFKSNRNTFLMQLELGERKHKKETRVSGDFNGFQFNSFIPGKMNNFFHFKAGVGQQKIIGSQSGFFTFMGSTDTTGSSIIIERPFLREATKIRHFLLPSSRAT